MNNFNENKNNDLENKENDLSNQESYDHVADNSDENINVNEQGSADQENISEQDEGEAIEPDGSNNGDTIEKQEQKSDEQNKESKRKKSVLKEVLQWASVIVVALIVSLLLRSFVFEFVMVDGPSMQKTMFTGQRLVVYKLGYQFSFPKRGDIVVFKFQEGTQSEIPFLDNMPLNDKILPKKDEVDYIKRVIAVPGDKVDIRDGSVYVNDKKLVEPYAVGVTNAFSGLKFPIDKIPPNKIFAVGDNREMSSDSRMIGLIDISQVKGKAVFRIYPFDKMGSL
ncbi:MAG: signal peptidase I [Bacillota bacterium]|nr:signal peptidase I [Bacillota bacterium]